MAEQHDETESSTGPDKTEPETNETEQLAAEGAEAEAAPQEGSTSDLVAAPKKKKKKKRALEAEASAQPSRDRNRRLREEAAGGGRRTKRDVPTRNLEAGEIVDDALARSSQAAGEWLKKNFNVVQWFLVAGIVAWVGYAIYNYRAGRAALQASAQLTTAIRAENGMIGTDDSKPEQHTALVGNRQSFPTDADRLKAAEKQYRSVSDSSSGNAGTFAKLGLASVLYDQAKFADAKAAYQSVKDSKLASQDVAVKGRALEGVGISAEAAGDKEGALKAFGELSNIDALGFNALGAYHQARLEYAAGNAEKAKTLLKDAQKHLDALTTPEAKKSAGSATPGSLQQLVHDLLRRIDPTAVPAPATGLSSDQIQELSEQMGDGSGKMSSEKLQELLRRMAKSPGGMPPSVPAPPASAP